MKTLTKNSLKIFIESELLALVTNVKANYDENMAARENNPFLPIKDKNIKKNMAIGRSVDSQLGNRMQRIIFYMARMKYGDVAVPNIVTINKTDGDSVEICTYSVPIHTEENDRKKDFNPFSQVVYIGQSFSINQVKEKLKLKKKSEVLIEKRYTLPDVPENALKYIEKPKRKTVPVDLLYLGIHSEDLVKAETFEIKLGGKLDTKNSGGNADEVEELTNVFSCLKENEAFFGTCYGECSQPVAKKIEKLDRASVLNNKDLWEKVIPTNIVGFTYEQFIDMYQKAFKKSKLETTIKYL